MEIWDPSKGLIDLQLGELWVIVKLLPKLLNFSIDLEMDVVQNTALNRPLTSLEERLVSLLSVSGVLSKSSDKLWSIELLSVLIDAFLADYFTSYAKYFS